MSAMEEINSDMSALFRRTFETLIIKAMKEMEVKTTLEKEKSFNELEKKNPSKIKNADVDKAYSDIFMKKAKENNIKAIKIIEGKETDTVKYSIDDEHTISDIFKEIQEKGINIISENKFDFKKGLELLNLDKVKEFFKQEFKEEIKESAIDRCINSLISDFEAKQEKRINLNDIDKVSEVMEQKNRERSNSKNPEKERNNEDQELEM